MKSSRYEILPRVRFRHGIDELPWVCTWKDPGELTQHAGWPLRYVNAYVGYGETMQEAIGECRRAYIDYKLKKLRMASWMSRNFNDEGEYVPKTPAYVEVPVHCTATSNLPWWRRLFRV